MAGNSAGTDTVVYQGPLGRQGLSVNSDGSYTVSSDLGTASDVLVHVERLAFTGSSEILALSGYSLGNSAYRLYKAAFDRTPDDAGLGYWIAQLEHGTSLHDTAQNFINSAEFATLYASAASDRDFVARLYQNVLHRAGEQAGSDYWTGVLQNGAERADVLSAFSESPENQAAVAALIAQGYTYLPWH